MATKSIQYVTENYEAELAAKVDETGGASTNQTLTTPTIDGELSSATKQQRLTAVAAEYGAGARGMQLIETWAPTESAASHAFSIDGDDWRELLLIVKGVGNGINDQTIKLQSDGADTGCTSKTVSGGGHDYTTKCVLMYSGPAVCTYVVRLTKLPTGEWALLGAVSASVYHDVVIGKLAAITTSLTILDEGPVAHFVGDAAVAKLYGVADEVSATVPSVGIFGAVPVTYTVDYTDAAFQVASTAASKTLVTLNANEYLCGVSVRPQTAFAGTGISAATCSLGSATEGNEAIYTTSLDIMQTDGSRSAGGLFSAPALTVPDTNLAVVLHCTATGANFGDGGSTVLTAGKLWITLYVATLPDGT